MCRGIFYVGYKYVNTDYINYELYQLIIFLSYFSLLSGTANSGVVIHDLHNVTGLPTCKFQCVAQIDRETRNAHKFSVETVQWYPLDTGMFITSGTDKIMKIWDANHLEVDKFQLTIINHDSGLFSYFI